MIRRRINDYLLVLWVCRVPAFSVFIGVLLLALVPQVQDLFIDAPTGEGWWVVAMTWLRAGWFALLLLILWAGPVFFAARSAVNDDALDDALLRRDNG